MQTPFVLHLRDTPTTIILRHYFVMQPTQ